MSSTPTKTTHTVDHFLRSIRKHLNFYRVHILFFTLTPLVFSGIFYASNGRYHISYIDALYNSVSAITVCGLSTVNLSTLTGWQQAILFIQMCLGSPVVVSWVMVYIRRYYFAKKFQHIIEAEAARKLQREETRRLSQLEEPTSWPSRLATLIRQRTGLSVVPEVNEDDIGVIKERKGGSVFHKLRPDMIRRMDDAPRLINPSGWISEGRTKSPQVEPSARSDGNGSYSGDTYQQLADQYTSSPKPVSASLPASENPETGGHQYISPESFPQTLRMRLRRLSDPGTPSRRPSLSREYQIPRFETMNAQNTNTPTSFGRTQTVEFAPVPRRQFTSNTIRGRRDRLPEPSSAQSRSGRMASEERRSSIHRVFPGIPLQSHLTNQTNISTRAKHTGFGGFPMPHAIASSLLRRFFPQTHHRLTRTMTIPMVPTMASQRDLASLQAKPAPYISFAPIVGRNSAFHMLTNDQLEELGGVEYRALNALLWIVAGYHFGIQLVSFVVIAPYISTPRWKDNFVQPQLFRPVSPTWFSIYQVVSAYTNTGTSLVDQSMLPFQRAYPMIVFIIILILAGNTAFPVFLRFMIWILSKLAPKESRVNETLHFLLDHPRRCFIYLFPSHQTWFLLTVLIGLNCTDWFFFLVLDIGNPDIASIPIGVRFIIGLLQAAAVRAAGFGIVTLNALAPAVKVLYVVMMYVSVYPIAMSVRSTNVYEEQSLGIFNDEEDEEEDNFQPTGSRVVIWSRYLAMHARRQLAFDMWWLGFALFLICIIERDNLDNPHNQSWFNVFNIVFEIVSAYGTVGLSLGIPTQNYSLSGAFRPLSKLIICLVMLRGRHRGLPVAIDRAVMLPAEFHKPSEGEDHIIGSPPPHRRSSQGNFSTGVPSLNEVMFQDDASERRRRKIAKRGSSQDAHVDEMRSRSAREDRDMA